MTSSTRVFVKELNQVGAARRTIGKICTDLHASDSFSGKASLVATELGRNIVVHGGGGELVFGTFSNGTETGIEIIAIDRGPGMRNVAECLRDGYSTAGTPGTGLGAVKRLSAIFDLSTAEGKGTVITTRLLPDKAAPAAPRWTVGALSIPLAGEDVCGDAWAVEDAQGGMRLLVADGLGHGPLAAEASQAAARIFHEHRQLPVEEVLNRMHLALQATRGAAAAIIELSPQRSQITMAGVGNISVRIFDREGASKQFASVNGTLGASLRKVQSYVGNWSPGSLLVAHSDGVSANWNPANYPGLLQRHPSTIAGVLYRDFSRVRDDATVVVIPSSR